MALRRLCISLAITLIAGACGGSESPRSRGLELARTPGFDGLQEAWLNEPLVFEFTKEVGAFSINSDSIRIETLDGRPARGQFLREPRRVKFQPVLAVNGLEDGGLLPDTEYRVIIRGFPHFTGVFTKSYEPLNRSYEFRFRTRGVDSEQLYLDRHLEHRATVTRVSVGEESWLTNSIGLRQEASETFFNQGLVFHFNKHLLPVIRGSERIGPSVVSLSVITDDGTTRNELCDVALEHGDDASDLIVTPRNKFRGSYKQLFLLIRFETDERGDALLRDFSGNPVLPFPDGHELSIVASPPSERLESRLRLEFLEMGGEQPVLTELGREQVLRTRTEGFSVVEKGWRLDNGAGTLELRRKVGVPTGPTLGDWRPESSIVLDTDRHELQTAEGVVVVTGGQFDFDSVEIPFGVEVRAHGSRPLVLRTVGDFVLQGRIDVSGEPGTLGSVDPRTGARPRGGWGGPGAGRGGEGGVSPLYELALPIEGQPGFAPGDQLASGGSGGAASTAGAFAVDRYPKKSFDAGWTRRLQEGRERSVIDAPLGLAGLRGGSGGGGGGAVEDSPENGGGGGGGGGVVAIVAGGDLIIDGGEIVAGGGAGGMAGPTSGSGGFGSPGVILGWAARELRLDGGQLVARGGPSGQDLGWIQLEDEDGRIVPTSSLIEPEPVILPQRQDVSRIPESLEDGFSQNVAKYYTAVIDLGHTYRRVERVDTRGLQQNGQFSVSVWSGAELPATRPPDSEYLGGLDRATTEPFRYLALRIAFEVSATTERQAVRLALDELTLTLSR
ncbi:MAG: hypothetical protein RL885_07925 [Planctomycetota bacterium]